MKVKTYTAQENSLVEGAKAFVFGNKLDEKATTFDEALNQAMAEEELMKLRWAISDALYDTIQEITEDEATSDDEKVTAITLVYQQYGAAMSNWWSRMLALTSDSDVEDATKDDEEEIEVKKGASISATTKGILAKCMKMHNEAVDMTKSAVMLHKKAVARHGDALLVTKALTESGSTTDADEYDTPAQGKKPPKKGHQAPVQPPPPVDDQEAKNAFHSLIEETAAKMGIKPSA